MRWFIIFCIITMAITAALIRADYHSQTTEQIDSTAIYRQEVADLGAELTKALALQQCYHEELIRVVFKCYPDSIYTIPCNGRKVVVR